MRLHPPRSLAAFAAVGALALVTGAGCADQAKAARGMEIGIQDDAVFVGGGGKPYFRNRDRAYRLARALGVTRLRVNLIWAYTVPTGQRKKRNVPKPPNYQFGIVDDTIAHAAKYGIRVQLALTGPAPVWATRNKKLGNYKPNARLFAGFATAAVQHFKGRVDRYSIWNEPNWHSWLSPMKTAPRQYRALYRRSYSAIKAVDPGAKVLIGETAPYRRPGLSIAPLAFLRKVACRGCRLRADGYAHHPYDFTHAPTFRYPGKDNVTIGTLSRLTRQLDRLGRANGLRHNGRGKMPVYLTEYGYFANGRRALKPRLAAKYLAGGFKLALRNRRVKSMLQYLLVVVPRHRPYAFFNTGLVRASGKKLPVYNALRRFYRSNRGKVKRSSAPILF